MRVNWKLVLGSLGGAVAIHAAMVACGSRHDPGTDGSGSAIDAARDAIGDVLRTESSDARAQDANSCACAEQATNTFAAQIDRGRGTELPQRDYSTSSTSGTAGRLDDGTAIVWVNSDAAFYLADGSRVLFTCNTALRPDGSIARMQSHDGYCQIQSFPDYLTTAGHSVSIDGISIARLDDTHLEWRIPSISGPLFHRDDAGVGMDAGVVTISNIVFRASVPGAHFVTPDRDYVP